MMSETMTNALAVFSYEGNAITFKSENGVMVNATEMAKPFGKSANHWLRNQSTQEFLDTYATLRNRNVNELVQIVNGGNTTNGTWLHEDVALEFARWLSPAFAIWCNDRIKELLTQGVAVNPLAGASRKDILMMALRAEEEAESLRMQIEADRSKVIFANAVMGSTTSCLIGELAKVLRQNGVEMGEKRLFEYLRQNGYLGTKGERYNVPNQRYIEQGIFEIKKGVRSGSGGVLHTTITTKVTPKGQSYFIEKFLRHIEPVAI